MLILLIGQVAQLRYERRRIFDPDRESKNYERRHKSHRKRFLTLQIRLKCKLTDEMAGWLILSQKYQSAKNFWSVEIL